LSSGRDPLHFPGLQLCRTRQQSQAINNIKGTAIILAGAGMCTGGRIKHHLVTNISRPESTILFCGFQSPGTLGREIVDGNPEVRILGGTFPVRAAIKNIQGFSAHADHSGLVTWITHFTSPIKRVFLTHGEADAAEALGRELRDVKKMDVKIPEYRETVELT
jgi:metallo-beta-lactamase family protein